MGQDCVLQRDTVWSTRSVIILVNGVMLWMIAELCVITCKYILLIIVFGWPWFTICNTNTSMHAQFQQRTWKLVQPKPDQPYRLLLPWCMCMCMWVWWCVVCHICGNVYCAFVLCMHTPWHCVYAGHHPLFLLNVSLKGFLSWCVVGLGWCVVGLGWCVVGLGWIL